ncbi:Macrophage colony-stimulating factor 1 receptor [Exophiala oligosperma]
MSDLNNLVGQPITRDTSFNWTWFIEIATCACLALFFLFYFNRLFATVVSYGLRAWTWHKYRIWIDIQALQLSFLAGRIFFKGIRYHGENETVLIQNGYITWRYWQRTARQVDFSGLDDDDNNKLKEKEASGSDDSEQSEPLSADQELGRTQKPDTADARIAINVTGLEWFVYNRTPVYQAIVSDATLSNLYDIDEECHESDHKQGSFHGMLHRRKNARGRSEAGLDSDSSTELPTEKTDRVVTRDELNVPVSRINTDTSVNTDADLPATQVSSFYSLLLRFLPIGVEVSKGAITLGNATTRAIVVSTFAAARGHVDAAAAGPCDIFRQVFDFDIEQPKVEMRPNPDFRASQLTTAERVISAAESEAGRRRWWQLDFGIRRRLARAIRSARHLFPGLRSSRGSLRTNTSVDDENNKHYFYEAFPEQDRSWHGLGRYMDDDERDDHEGWSHVDYARFSQILESPNVHLNFYWDLPGQVLAEHVALSEDVHTEDINWSTPPAYGLDLTVHGGTVNYGPWADRLRFELQSAFFPNPFRSATPSSALKVGDARLHTVMSIRVDLEDEVNLRVPTRERSKDWQWRGRAHAVREAAAIRKQRERRHFRFRRPQKSKLGPDLRPFGWLTVSAGKDSTVRYDMDMVPNAEGYRNQLRLDLKDTKATSSVNHALLWRCQSQKVSCDLSNPLVWNSLHTWVFDIENNAMEMFLLRDHMFLLTDLISDFTESQKPDYMTFVPYLYQLHLQFPDLKLYLNANDYNIVDNPCDLDENSFLVLGFQVLDGHVDIPMQCFSPRQSSVKFLAEGHNAYLDLSTPVWNTLHTLAEDKTMATLKRLDLDGSYNYYPQVSPKLTDSLFMTITGSTPKFYLHGYLIRYFMNVKENYFGEDLHFRTLEEYQDILAGNAVRTPRPAMKKENDLDVILTVRADNSSVLLPANIYSRRENLRVDVLLVEADMRFTNYYMDLQVNSSPLEASLETIQKLEAGPSEDITNCQLFIDGAQIYGHRLFGAPPTEPTYVCCWDIDVGEATGEVDAKFVQVLINAITSFIYTLDDYDNALPKLFTTKLHDVTFLRASVAGLRIWLTGGGAAFLIESNGADISLSDWANANFAQSVQVNVPHVVLAAVDHKSALRHHGREPGIVETVAYFQTALRICSLDKSDNLNQTRSLQQQHVKYHDQRSHRAQWILGTQKSYPPNHKTPEWAREPPAMPLPTMPEPVVGVEGLDVSATNDPTYPDQAMVRKSSFLSTMPFLHGRPVGNTNLASRSSRDPNSSLSRPLDPRLRSSMLQDGSKEQLADAVKSSSLPEGTHPALAFAGPWSPPHFTLRDVKPDTKNMPTVSRAELTEAASLMSASKADFLPKADDFEGVPHNGVVFMIDKGLTGFCSPALFLCIGGLIQELNNDHAINQLDKIQVTLMEKILESQRHDDKGHVMDFAIHVPFAHIKLLNSLQGGPQIQSSSDDQYDVKLLGTQAMFRSLHPQLNSRYGKISMPSQSAYASIEKVTVSARDDAFADRAATQAEVSLSNFGFWLCLQDKIDSKCQLSNFSVVLWAEQLANMAGLIQRTLSMIDRIADAFVGLDQSRKSRHLIFHLTQGGSSISEPIFLTKPSYVLRSADKHVRLTDSWKIMSRLRYIFATLEKEKGPKSMNSCDCEDLELKGPALQRVLTSFEQWRGWDYRRDTVPIMSTLFENQRPGTSAKPPGSLAAQGEIIIGKIEVVLDPGPRQSDFTLLGLDFNVVVSPVTALPGAEDNSEKVILQAYLADASLNLNWALVELARQIIDLGNPLAMFPTRTSSGSKVDSDKTHSRRQFTVVVGSDVAAIYLTTLNLKLKWASEGFRSAVSFDSGGSLPSVHSWTIAANSVLTKVRGHSHTLMTWKLRAPKVYGSVWPRQSNDSQESVLVIQVCAASRRYRFQLKEDIAKLLGVVENVVHDEAAAVYDLLGMLPKDSNPEPKKMSRPLAASIELRTALFLDDYRLSFAIVPTLLYTIAGNVARTSILPRKHGSLEINFDIKEHEHLFEGPHVDTRSKSSILKMPPINGRLSIAQTTSVMSIGARVTIEQINLEASGIRACFDALNQPGVIQQLLDTKRAVQDVQNSVKYITDGKSKAQKTTSAETTLLLRYAVHGTLAGIKVHMSAPTVREDQTYRADMELKLEGTSLFVHNQTDDPDTIHEQPQFILNSQGVGLGIYRATDHAKSNVGKCTVGIKASGKTEPDGKLGKVHVYRAWSDGIAIELYEDTATLAVDIAGFIQDKIKSIQLAESPESIQRLRRMTTAGITDRLRPKEQIEAALEAVSTNESFSSALYDSTYAVNVDNIHIRWNLTRSSFLSPTRELQDLVFSIRKVDLQTRQEGTSRLSILDTQLQIVPQSQSLQPTQRTANSALLPEVVFGSAYLSTKRDRRFAFQAKGKAVDIRLATDFAVPAHALQKSLAHASEELRNSKKLYETSPQAAQSGNIDFLGGKRLASLLVDADFAGAVVYISPWAEVRHQDSAFSFLKGGKRSRAGRYGQAVQGENASSARLQSPGVALKVEYKDNGSDDPYLSTEVKVAASTNTLYPTVVPLILEISSSIKEIMGENSNDDSGTKPGDISTHLSEETINNANPTAILGRCKLNAGLYIQRQEFSLSCQPIARVAATTRFSDIFVRINTVSTPDHERFFAILTTFNKLEASVQHVYSRESTANFEVDSIVLSLMNSKHVSASTGISAVLNVSPMKTDINAKQLQDFLLFREIWYPAELRGRSKSNAPVATAQDQQAYAMQRYQEISAKGTLPWHAIVSMQEIKLAVDFGQGLGKSVFTISQLWASSKKNNDSEQNLCIGFDRVGIDSNGRMSGFVELENMRLRTSIRWPEDSSRKARAPLVQASISFEHFRVKAAFDYQPFAVADISFFEFLMYNVRQGQGFDSDRLVGIVDGGKVQVYVTTSTAAQGFALVQAFERLAQEKQEAYETSLHDLDKFLRRKSIFPSNTWVAPTPDPQHKEEPQTKRTFALHTDVVVGLREVDIGCFPNTFFDDRLLKAEATEVQARFAVATTDGKTHSGLGMTLGELRVALSNVNRTTTKALSEVSVPDVIDRATSSRGGTIVKVPRLVSSMETWQVPDSNTIEYIFRSTFEGKVDVGWNYARISFIRGMWQTHSRALAQRLGKPLPPSAIKVTAEPQGDGEGGQEKITAVVNVPQSKFTYIALEPPIIDTPQLRDMGEATPPLEWIGLHRDRLPEATHSIAIVTLSEIAREVEDAYARILGAS